MEHKHHVNLYRFCAVLLGSAPYRISCSGYLFQSSQVDYLGNSYHCCGLVIFYASFKVLLLGKISETIVIYVHIQGKWY